MHSCSACHALNVNTGLCDRCRYGDKGQPIGRVIPFRPKPVEAIDPFAVPTHDLVSVNPFTPPIILFMCRKIGWYRATEMVWDTWLYVDVDAIVAEIEAMELNRLKDYQ
jgi:hypothetical protein